MLLYFNPLYLYMFESQKSLFYFCHSIETHRIIMFGKVGFFLEKLLCTITYVSTIQHAFVKFERREWPSGWIEECFSYMKITSLIIVNTLSVEFVAHVFLVRFITPPVWFTCYYIEVCSSIKKLILGQQEICLDS